MLTLNEELLEKIRRVKLLILDVDGVLTDGRLFFDDQGQEYKCFHAQDGHGIKLLRRAGIEVAVISGRDAKSVATRMQSLGVAHVFQGRENKREAYRQLLQQLALNPEQTAYVGDDLLDLPIMTQAGFAVAVANANFAVQRYAHWQTSLPGGLGAVREVCDLILQVQGHYEQILQDYLWP